MFIMKKLIITFSLLSTMLCFSQNFSKVYYSNQSPIGASPCMQISSGDTLYAFSFVERNPQAINLRSFNRSGNVIDSVFYQWDSTHNGIVIRTNSLKRISKEKLVSIHDFFYKGGSAFTNIFLIKNNLDTIKTTEFRINDTVSTNAYDLWVDDSTITILGHYLLPNNKSSLYIAQYDTTLNLLWYKTIADFRPIANQYFNGYFPYKIIRKGNYYYLAGRALYTNQFVEGFLVKTDLQGNKIWDKRYQYQNQNTFFTSMLDIGSDSLFVPFIYLSKNVGNTPYGMIQFRILDTSGVTIKDSAYPDEEIIYLLNNVTKAKDGNILLVGEFYQGGQKSIIWKMDKNLNTIWRRVYYYGDWEDESYLYNIGEWSDGGIVSVGTYVDRYLNPTIRNVYLWLLSTDANGCLSGTNCGSGIGFKEWTLDQAAVKVFPNPATEFINIELPPNKQVGTLRMYTTNGRLLLKQHLTTNLTKIELSNINSQMLMLEIEVEGKIYMKKIILK